MAPLLERSFPLLELLESAELTFGLVLESPELT